MDPQPTVVLVVVVVVGVAVGCALVGWAGVGVTGGLGAGGRLGAGGFCLVGEGAAAPAWLVGCGARPGATEPVPASFAPPPPAPSSAELSWSAAVVPSFR